MTSAFDIDAVRRQFPVTGHCLYLDSAHQTPLAASVRAAFDAFLDEAALFAGPKPTWLARIPRCRARIAALIGARPDEIAFTKNTSEGLNIAANALGLRPGDTVLMMEGDHPNNTLAWLNLERQGVRVRYVPACEDGADVATFAPAINSSTRVIALSHVISPTGQQADLAGIGRLCRLHGIHLVVDAVQSLGTLPVDVDAMGISMLASSCHKGLLVPHGLGILYVNNALTDLQPAYLSGASVIGASGAPAQQHRDELVLRDGAARFEIGNPSLAHLHALDAALQLIEGIGIARIEAHLLDLGERLIAHMDRLGVCVVGSRQRERRSHINTLRLPGDHWGEHFAMQSVRVSQNGFGHRVSFAMFNTADEVDALAEIIAARLP
jgi:selenocysteine lyase/cysteine desulfurase